MDRRHFLYLMGACALGTVGTSLTACSPDPDITQTSLYVRNTELAKTGTDLIIAGWRDEDDPIILALMNAAARFTSMYSHTTISYRKIGDGVDVLKGILPSSYGIDLFMLPGPMDYEDHPDSSLDDAALRHSGGIVEGLQSMAEELWSMEDLTLGGALKQGLEYMSIDGGTLKRRLYGVPIGSAVRGLYVNRSLLGCFESSAPLRHAGDLLYCSRQLMASGYLPFGCAPGSFARDLMEPHMAGICVSRWDDGVARRKLRFCQHGTGELFRDPVSVLYKILSRGYYSPSTLSLLGLFQDGSDEEMARSFFASVDATDYAGRGDLNAAFSAKNSNGDRIGLPAGQTVFGCVGFMPGLSTMTPVMERVREETESQIEYDFVCAPTSMKEGFGLLAQSDTLSISNHSRNTRWAVEFLNFFFNAGQNTIFAQEANLAPNISNVHTVIAKQLGLAHSRDVIRMGDLEFCYPLRTILCDTLDKMESGLSDRNSVSEQAVDRYVDSIEEQVTSYQPFIAQQLMAGEFY